MINPFSYTWVDYTALSGEEQFKMYNIVFTCLEVRAVNLELVEDPSIFLMGFIRFIDSYGIRSLVYSDNAKSFVV